MGSAVSRVLKAYDTQLYKWSNEFVEEVAAIYTVTGHAYPSRSCTFYYGVNPDKLIIAMDDGLCKDNRVRVNMEVEAVRDENGRFKFGAVNCKEKGGPGGYVLRYRRPNTTDDNRVLYLTYDEDPDMRRRDYLQVKRTSQKTEYEVYFYSSVGIDVYGHHMSVICDPSDGIRVKFTGPFRSRLSTRKDESIGTEYVSGKPPYDVIENVLNVRNYLRIKDWNRVEAPHDVGHDRPPQCIHNEGNLVINDGNVTGDGNGCINNGSNQLKRSDSREVINNEIFRLLGGIWKDK